MFSVNVAQRFLSLFLWSSRRAYGQHEVGSCMHVSFAAWYLTLICSADWFLLSLYFSVWKSSMTLRHRLKCKPIKKKIRQVWLTITREETTRLHVSWFQLFADIRKTEVLCLEHVSCLVIVLWQTQQLLRPYLLRPEVLCLLSDSVYVCVSVDWGCLERSRN